MSRKNRRVNEENREINEAVIFGGARTEVKKMFSIKSAELSAGGRFTNVQVATTQSPAGATSVTVIELNRFLGQNAALDDRRH
ncbi:MAG: hypothetical protein LBP35_01805 [Candidatus Ancillula trichonymphae]|jgi:hypothetical protein|nr:hypothetical protein [Candidatus Ancillula trichonymphae]